MLVRIGNYRLVPSRRNRGETEYYAYSSLHTNVLLTDSLPVQLKVEFSFWDEIFIHLLI